MNKLSRYRKLRYNQLFESENRELRLNEMGNPLEVLSQYVDFEIFRKFERLKLTNWAVKEFCCLIQEDKLN